MGYIETEINAEIENWEQSQANLRAARIAAIQAQREVLVEIEEDRKAKEFDNVLMGLIGRFGTNNY